MSTKLCTCDGAGRGPGRACVVKAGKRLGELWRCAESAEPAERSVADIPDAELLRRVVRSVARNRPRRKEFAWAAVSEAFGLGSTYSMQLCRRFGLDPDTGADERAAP